MKSTRGVSPPRGRASRARTARRRRFCSGEAARHLPALEDEIQASATEILAKFPELVNMRRSRSVADPFVIALARVQGLTVITAERASGSPQEPRIPYVCALRPKARRSRSETCGPCSRVCWPKPACVRSASTTFGTRRNAAVADRRANHLRQPAARTLGASITLQVHLRASALRWTTFAWLANRSSRRRGQA
jgi:hypothetical protein